MSQTDSRDLTSIPEARFQHRACAYFYFECIIGNFWAPADGVNQIGGFIGPCHVSPNLERIQHLRVCQSPVMHALGKREIKNFAKRSGPLCPPDDSYPISDYDMAFSLRSSSVDTIRVQRWCLCPTSDSKTEMTIQMYGAAVVFAIGGDSALVTLRYNVSFHFCCNLSLLSTPLSGPLLVEAFGAPDNEVSARARCAHLGLSAIVANLQTGCVSCAITLPVFLL